MLPLKDNVPTRVFPVLTVALIVANVLVWLLYEDAGEGRGFVASLNEGAYQPCEVDGSCEQIGYGWPVNLFTSMFMHADWMHLIGNMLFLWIFGNNVEDTLGRVRFVAFYLLGGIAATALQTVVTLGYASEQAAEVPNLGASGAIAAVLGAYVVLHPGGSVLTWIAPIFIFPIPAVLYLGLWFVFQLIEGGYSFTHPEQGGGVAYFAHIGGFAFGFLAIKVFSAGRPRPLRPSY
ncbi:MAG: rhomboid family intramembrane serine protease [Actinomycetota bacterium]|nr:rhomboid family intramembrane serine protease [Actinomycetota bacterium]